jgi:hypothetical protein
MTPIPLPAPSLRLKPLLAAVATLAASLPALAHHAFAAEFDADQPIEVRGAITKLNLVNPHSWVFVDVKDASGKVTNWGFEFAAPFALQQRGLTKADLPPGTEINLKGYRAKSGKAFAYAASARLADGRVIPVGGAQDIPEPAASEAK